MKPFKIPCVEKITGSPNLRYKRRVPPTLQGVIGKKLWTDRWGRRANVRLKGGPLRFASRTTGR